jgi:hypothetical protein
MYDSRGASAHAGGITWGSRELYLLALLEAAAGEALCSCIFARPVAELYSALLCDGVRCRALYSTVDVYIADVLATHGSVDSGAWRLDGTLLALITSGANMCRLVLPEYMSGGALEPGGSAPLCLPGGRCSLGFEVGVPAGALLAERACVALGRAGNECARVVSQLRAPLGCVRAVLFNRGQRPLRLYVLLAGGAFAGVVEARWP